MIRHTFLFIALSVATTFADAVDRDVYAASTCQTSASESIRRAHAAELAAATGDTVGAIWVRAKLLQWDQEACLETLTNGAPDGEDAEDILALWQSLLHEPALAPHLLYDAVLNPRTGLSPAQRAEALQRLIADDPHNAQTWLVALQRELQQPHPQSEHLDALLFLAQQQAQFSRAWMAMAATWWRELGALPATGPQQANPQNVGSNTSAHVASDRVRESLHYAIATSPLASTKTLHAVCGPKTITPHRQSSCHSVAKLLATQGDSLMDQRVGVQIWSQLAVDEADAADAARSLQELDALDVERRSLADTDDAESLLSAAWIEVLEQGGREIDVQRVLLQSAGESLKPTLDTR